MLKRTTVIETVTLFNIILFLYTGISKIRDYSIFKEQLAENPMLSSISEFIAVSLPIVEFIVVLMLAIPKWRLKGLYSTLVLLIAFTIYVIALFAFSRELPCNCGGIIELLSWEEHLAFNAAFIGLTIWAINLLRHERIDLAKDRQQLLRLEEPSI